MRPPSLRAPPFFFQQKFPDSAVSLGIKALVPHCGLPTQARFTDHARAGMGPLGVGESFSPLRLLAPGALPQAQAHFADPPTALLQLDVREGLLRLGLFASGALPQAQALFAHLHRTLPLLYL